MFIAPSYGYDTVTIDDLPLKVRKAVEAVVVACHTVFGTT